MERLRRSRLNGRESAQVEVVVGERRAMDVQRPYGAPALEYRAENQTLSVPSEEGLLLESRIHGEWNGYVAVASVLILERYIGEVKTADFKATTAESLPTAVRT